MKLECARHNDPAHATVNMLRPCRHGFGRKCGIRRWSQTTIVAPRATWSRS